MTTKELVSACCDPIEGRRLSKYPPGKVKDMYTTIVTHPSCTYTLGGRNIGVNDIYAMRAFLKCERMKYIDDHLIPRDTEGRKVLNMSTYKARFSLTDEEAIMCEWLYRRSDIYPHHALDYALHTDKEIKFVPSLISMFTKIKKWYDDDDIVDVQLVMGGGYVLDSSGQSIARSAMIVKVDGAFHIMCPRRGLIGIFCRPGYTYFYLDGILYTTNPEHVSVVLNGNAYTCHHVADVYIYYAFKMSARQGYANSYADVKRNSPIIKGPVTPKLIKQGKVNLSSVYLGKMFDGENDALRFASPMLDGYGVKFACEERIYYDESYTYCVMCPFLKDFRPFERSLGMKNVKEAIAHDLGGANVQIMKTPVLGEAISNLMSNGLAYRNGNDCTMSATNGNLTVKITMKDVPPHSAAMDFFRCRLNGRTDSLLDKDQIPPRQKVRRGAVSDINNLKIYAGLTEFEKLTYCGAINNKYLAWSRGRYKYAGQLKLNNVYKISGYCEVLFLEEVLSYMSTRDSFYGSIELYEDIYGVAMKAYRAKLKEKCEIPDYDGAMEYLLMSAEEMLKITHSPVDKYVSIITHISSGYNFSDPVNALVLSGKLKYDDIAGKLIPYLISIREGAADPKSLFAVKVDTGKWGVREGRINRYL